MYISYINHVKTVSKVDKLRFRLRRDCNNILDYKSRGVGAFDCSDYTTLTEKESHVLDLIKRK